MSRLRTWVQNFDFLKPERVKSLLWIGLPLFFSGAFIKLSFELREDSVVESLDRNILLFISRLRTPVLNGLEVDITALGSPSVLALFSVIGVVLLWISQDRRGSTYLAIGSAGAGMGTFLIKHIFTRERPSIISRLVEVSGYSYPSGHSLGATSVYLLLMLLAWRYYRSWSHRFILMLFTALIISNVSFSRLYLGIHYPSDVLSGLLLGAAWVSILTYFFFGRSKNKTIGL